MKICLISFDFWNYDQYIVHELKNRGIEAHHINIGGFRHKNLLTRVVNMFSKIFLNRNLKYEKRQEYVKKTLEKIGHQDIILIINPETLELNTIEFASRHCNQLMAYLYDSLDRCPAQKVLHLFDKIFSFDHQDVEKYGFEKITNFNYLEYLPQELQNPNLGLFYITSFDKTRNRIIKPLSQKLSLLGIRSKIVVVGKKGWKLKMKSHFGKNLENISIQYRKKTTSTKATLKEYKNAKVLLDLMRSGQTGLSFRVFEAMAMEKKIITDNPEIKNYDFYNPHNILVLEENFSNLETDFFNTPYQKIPQEIYNRYTLKNWVEYVFNLNTKDEK